MEDGRRAAEAASGELLAVLDNIELLVKQLVTAASQAALYTASHPAATEYVRRAWETAAGILSRKESFAVSVREEMLVYESIPLYRLSVSAGKFIELLSMRKIHGLIIRRGLSAEEVVGLLQVLVAPPGTAEGREAVDRELERAGVRHAEAMEIREGAAEGPSRGPGEVYRDTVHLMRGAAHALLRGKLLDGTGIAAEADSIAELAARQTAEALSLAFDRRYDDDLYLHPVHVCLLAAALGSRLVSDPHALGLIARAALLHDIGKSFIPREILSRPGGLSEGERETVRRHPVEGARILAETEGIAPVCVVVAYEHHIHFDGGGYPAGAPGRRPHPASLLVQVVDAYDALTTRRPYRDPLPHGDALAVLVREAGTRFEPGMVAEFVRLMEGAREVPEGDER
ncbi:MAG: HD domain-containing protein [bacterium]|nr:HD domain-containing protein [bacterium]